MLVGGNLTEILRSFGYDVVFPEIVALNCAIKHQSLDNILHAESMGYGLDVCGYVKNDLGLQDLGGKTSFGQIPRPDLLVCSFSGCYVYVKWWEALAESYGAPLITYDVPYMREEAFRKEDIDYLVSQLWELIAQLEKRTGQAFDMEALKKVLAESRAGGGGMGRIPPGPEWFRPSPIEAYFESIFYMFPINVLRGTREAADFYEPPQRGDPRRGSRMASFRFPRRRFRVLVEGVPPVHELPDLLGLLPKVGSRLRGGDLPEGRGPLRPGVPARPVPPAREHRRVQPGRLREPVLAAPARSSPTTSRTTRWTRWSSTGSSPAVRSRPARATSATGSSTSRGCPPSTSSPTIRIRATSPPPRSRTGWTRSSSPSTSAGGAVAAAAAIPGGGAMSLVAGVDIGSTTAKCVVLDAQDRVLGKSLNPVGVDIVKDAERALEAALADAHLARSEVAFIIGTGYGRYKVYFGHSSSPRSPATRAGPLPLPGDAARGRHRRPGHQGDPDQRARARWSTSR